MDPKKKQTTVEQIMIEFAGLTGLTPSGSFPKRYLWTDAFAVCNFLELYRRTHDEKFKHLCLRLVNQVHHVLGRHRDDDRRTGWISGLPEEEGRNHPTIGGLRIGKKMKERSPGEPYDDRLEWERDGQYYHYLTKWMHALHKLSRITGDPIYHKRAHELAKTAHAKFVHVSPAGRKIMNWKMSIDLSSPSVPSTGHHDPLDGFITYSELKSSALKNWPHINFPDLSEEIDDMEEICRGKQWTTEDPLGLGGLLSDTYRVAQMMPDRTFDRTGLLSTLLKDCRSGLYLYAQSPSLGLRAEYRLAFRELGLSIGLHALERTKKLAEKSAGIFQDEKRSSIDIEFIMPYIPLIDIIENFWLEPSSREAASWLDHREINMVMLSTSLAPDEYLTL